MKIIVHKIRKFSNKWQITFTSDLNKKGHTVFTPVFSDEDDMFLWLEQYAKETFPSVVHEKPIEKDTSTLQHKKKEDTEDDKQIKEQPKEEPPVRNYDLEISENINRLDLLLTFKEKHKNLIAKDSAISGLIEHKIEEAISSLRSIYRETLKEEEG